MKGAFAQADGKRMELERELESAKADQEELEELRSQVKTLKTKYSKAQGYQMALERESTEKDETIEVLNDKVRESQKRFAQADGYRMKVERELLAQVEDLQAQLEKSKTIPES